MFHIEIFQITCCQIWGVWDIASGQRSCSPSFETQRRAFEGSEVKGRLTGLFRAVCSEMKVNANSVFSALDECVRCRFDMVHPNPNDRQLLHVWMFMALIWLVLPELAVLCVCSILLLICAGFVSVSRRHQHFRCSQASALGRLHNGWASSNIHEEQNYLESLRHGIWLQ